jgi:hypothetical protein
MQKITYTNKAGQIVKIQFEYKNFDNGTLIKGNKTLVNGTINKISLPPFYINGHADLDKIITSVAYYRANRKHLKNA